MSPQFPEIAAHDNETSPGNTPGANLNARQFGQGMSRTEDSAGAVEGTAHVPTRVLPPASTYQAPDPVVAPLQGVQRRGSPSAEGAPRNVVTVPSRQGVTAAFDQQ